MSENVGLKKELGLVAATSIVVGNMIGSGIFMAPQNLAAASNPKSTMIAWAITSIGSIFIALVFARLGEKYPTNGGPIVYTRKAFGDFAGFLIAWTYWIAGWIGNAALITAFMSYLTFFVPVFGHNRMLTFLVSSFILWLFTWINIKGAKEVGIVGIITTVCKILPLIVFLIIAALKFNPNNFSTVSDIKLSGIGTVPAAVAITLWSFIGVESASITAGEIKDPEKNVKKATILGIIITALIYIAISFFSIGAMNQGELAKSAAPLADIINGATESSWGATLIAAGALISTLGGTSGWILITSRIALSAGEDGLFPKIFAKIDKKTSTPANSIIISAIAANFLLILNALGSLQSAYSFMILLGTMAFLPAYTFSAIGEIILLYKHSEDFNLFNFIKSSIFSLIAFVYSIYAIYGTGAESVMWGFILMLAGMPFYAYIKIQARNKGIPNN